VSVRWYSVVVDCHDAAAQARWWAEVLGWEIAFEDEEESEIASAEMIEAPVSGAVPDSPSSRCPRAKR